MAGGAITLAFKVEDLGNGLQKLTLDADGLRKMMQATVTESQKAKESLMSWGALAVGVQSVNSVIGSLKSGISALTAESGQFGNAMKAANTMAGKDAAGFAELKGQVADLAKTVPMARDAIANGLYQTISNGVPENNWIEFLEASARSAVGGMADINQVVGVTATMIKNYGLEWSAAQSIQDKIQLTAKNGVTTFEQLAAALPRVAGNAATLGVSVDELMGTFATLTGVSGNTAEVSTQLAAIFTALVKPSSEATKMAQQMGIEFNAAAIKGAGGFQNFLRQIDSTVKSYAASTGMLEQEIYGKLFGSAEALRALVPLQGELATKFGQNIATMVNSAGTMDEAFGIMASTGGTSFQMLKNKIADFTDGAMAMLGKAKPYLNITADVGMSVSSLILLGDTLRKIPFGAAITSLRAMWVASGNLTSATRGMTKVLGTARLFIGQFFTACTQGAAGLKLFATAWRGLLISTGVGIAIAAVTTAIGYLVTMLDDAKGATEKFATAEEIAAKDAEAWKEAQQEQASLLKNTRAELAQNISKLKAFNGTKEEEKTLVSEMNTLYGRSMGYFATTAAWYEALTKNSKAYTQQIILESQARMLANKIAEKQQAIYELTHDENGRTKKFSTKQGERKRYIPGTQTYVVEKTASDFEKATAAVGAYQQAISNLSADLDKVNAKIGSIGLAVVGDIKPQVDPIVPQTPAPTKTPTATESNVPVLRETAETLSEVEENVRYYQKQLQTATVVEAEAINKSIAKWEEKARAIRNAGLEVAKAEDVEVTIVAEPQNIAEITSNINILRDQLETATLDKAAEINQQIKAQEALLAKFQNAGVEAKPEVLTVDPNAFNLKGIEQNISVLQDKLREADVTEAGILNQEIALWQKKADAIHKAGEETKLSMENMKGGWGAIKGIDSGVSAITEAVKSNGSAWEKTKGIVDGFLMVYDGIVSVIKFVQTLLALSQASTVAKTAETAASTASVVATGAEAGVQAASAAAKIPVIAANKAATASFLELASAQYMAAHAYIPFAGFGIGAGFSSSAVAAVKAIGLTPFANGGIVSGPTQALIGEYPGARSNPEVVAPLDRLRDLIQPQDGLSGRVTFDIEGRKLVGVLEREYSHRSRTR